MVSAAEIPPEILVLIFKYSQCHKDLLNFALVCRSWTEWAIDVVWRTCEVPLYKLLAILDLSNRDPDANDDAEWNEFVALSNKVTKVKCKLRLQRSEAASFDKRRKQHDGDALFQNVLELIVDMGFCDFRTASIVCSPKSPKSIRMYHGGIGFGCWPEAGWLTQADPLLSLASCAPSVESVYVNYTYTHIVPSLHRFARLRVVECHLPSTPFSWWRDLATCPRLTDLRLAQATTYHISGWASLVVFPMLERFHYTTPAKYMVPQSITGSSFPALTHFVIHPCPWPRPVEIIAAHLRDHSPLLQEFRNADDFVAQQ